MNYVRQIRPNKRIYDDIRQTAQYHFKYIEKEEGIQYANRLADKMHDLPIENILNNSVSFENPYDENSLMKVLNSMVPERLLIILSSPVPFEGGQL